MKLYKTILLKKGNYRKLIFNKMYFENICDYKFSGPDYLIDFELTITQNNDNTVTVSYDNLSDSEESIPFISEGIENFLSFLNSKNIGLSSGIDFKIENTKNHPVDFKPKMFVAFTFQRLKKIFFELSEKRIEKPIIDITNSINDDIAIFEDVPNKYYNLNVYELRNNIELPIIYERSLIFPQIKLKKIFSDLENFFQIELTIIPHYDNQRKDLKRIGHFSVSSSFLKENLETYISVRETLDILIREIYRLKYNLGGANIYIDILKYDSTYSGYAKLDFKYDLYYFIKELLLRGNSISTL